MRRQLLTAQAFRAALEPSSQAYICRQCLAQARSRTFHSSTPHHDRLPAWKKLLNRLTGSKEETETIEKRDAAQAQRLEKLESGEQTQEETMTLEGVEYKVATIFSPRINRDYMPAADFSELEVIGTDRWVKRMADQGEKYSSDKACEKQFQPSELQGKLKRIALQYLKLRQFRRLSQQQRLAIPENPSRGQAWFDIPLIGHDDKQRINEQIRLRMQGLSVSDFDMSKATKFEHIYNALNRQPEAKKLAKAKAVEAMAAQLPNVTVYEERQTPIHKEKAIGRWKIIEAELARRNLPITGSQWTNAKLNSVVKIQKPRKLKTKKGTRFNA